MLRTNPDVLRTLLEQAKANATFHAGLAPQAMQAESSRFLTWNRSLRELTSALSPRGYAKKRQH